MTFDKPRATTGEKLDVMAKSRSDDPQLCRANGILKQLAELKGQRSGLFKQAEQLTQRIDTLEAEFHKLVLELKPTEVVVGSRKIDPMAALKKAINERLSEQPNLLEQLEKIVGKLNL